MAEKEAKPAPPAPDPADALAGTDDSETPDGPPRVWLAYNPNSKRHFGHIPLRGSGPNGEFSPQEVAHYFPTKAQYEEATHAPDGGEALYVRVKAPTEARDPAAAWKATNPAAYGKEGAAHGES